MSTRQRIIYALALLGLFTLLNAIFDATRPFLVRSPVWNGLMAGVGFVCLLVLPPLLYWGDAQRHIPEKKRSVLLADAGLAALFAALGLWGLAFWFPALYPVAGALAAIFVLGMLASYIAFERAKKKKAAP